MSEELSLEDLKLTDMEKTLAVAKDIVTACIKDKMDIQNNKNNAFCNTAKHLKSATKTSNDTILDKISKMKRPNKTFREWFKEQSLQRTNTSDITQLLDVALRETLFNQYVVKQTIPTLKSICDEFKSKGLISSKVEIKKVLLTKGYKRQRLPRTNATIIVESPEERVKKMKYLYQIIQSTNIKSHIIYIEDKIIIDKEDQSKNRDLIRILLAVSSSMGMIAKDVKKVPLSDEYDALVKVEDWIISTVLPYVSIPSVIVIEDDIINNTPTIYSKRCNMINWLIKNDIPHSTKMHTAELYELIKNCQGLFPETKRFDELLMAYGHKVLRRPYPSNYFNILSSIWDDTNFQKREGKELSCWINVTLSSLDVKQWNSLIEAFYNIEENIYNETNAMDEVIDKILTYAKYENVPKEFLIQFDKGIDEVKMSEIIIE